MLESQWKNGRESAVQLSKLFEERGLKGCRVLDVPCGIGRVSVPLAKLGYEVVGVDISPYFVQLAKEKARQFGVAKRATFRVGSMKEVGSLFPRPQFDAAMNIFTSIGFGSEKDDLVFFRGLRQVVKKGGLFVIDRLANRDFITSHFCPHLYQETDQLLVLETNEMDLSRSRLKSNWRFYQKRDGSLKYVVKSNVELRLYSPHELVTMLAGAGWKVSGVYDSLSKRGPFSSHSLGMSLVAEAI